VKTKYSGYPQVGFKGWGQFSHISCLKTKTLGIITVDEPTCKEIEILNRLLLEEKIE